MLLVALTLVALFARPLTPIDETRYVSVAWEMWLNGDPLVLYKNGAPYSHKPPLLFWLINLGWAVFGVNELWPRLISPLFSLASLALTLALARRLWPEEATLGERAAWILCASALWLLFSTATMFDVMLACFALLGALGLLIAAEGGWRKGFALLALALGLGLLTKGPVILLHLLPLALLAPLWAPAVPKGRWYGGLTLSVLAGAAIALLWAIPAALAGGEEYRQMILWGQTAKRMVNSFAHQRPFWWYLPLLPLLFFPWLFWPRLWRALAALRRAPRERGLVFLAVWLAPTFLALCLISGKQVHYLVPLFPPFALAAARLTHEAPQRRLAAIAMGAALCYALVQGAAAPFLWRHADMRPIAQEIRKYQDTGIAIAHAGEYHAEYQFAGRLTRPLAEIEATPAAIAAWFSRHPDGLLLHYSKAPPTGPSRFVQPYLQKHVALLDAQQARGLGLF
ncbi:MAG: glycosyltransferase family 39 protein [Rhodocyclaceae bacterium]|nr:glycosyltransferase family 39 protein [Rhodocyclaceae bacterium]